VAESCTICSSRSRRPVRKLLVTPSYTAIYALIVYHISKFYVAGVAQSVRRLCYGFDIRGSIPGGTVTASIPALGHTQPRMQLVPGVPTPEVKGPGRETDQSPPPSDEDKNAWSCASVPHTSSWIGA